MLPFSFQLLFVLGNLLAISPTYALPRGQTPNAPVRNARSTLESTQIPSLRPLHSDTFHAALGLRTRSLDDLSRLTPSSTAELLYGALDNSNTTGYTLANMTLYAPDGKPILLMENFNSLTSSVDCEGVTDGQLSITFKTKDIFSAALDRWSYIHEDADKEFIIVASPEAEGCAPNLQRQAYIVRDVDNDEARLITHLSVSPVGWEEIAGTFDFSFGKGALPATSSPRLRRRAFWDWEKKQSTDFKVSIGKEKEVHNIVSANNASVDCSNCFVSGTFSVQGKIRASAFVPKELSITVSPRDFKAALEIATDIGPEFKEPSLEQELPLFPDQPIPHAGLKIDGLFALGAVAGVSVGFGLEFDQTSRFKVGVAAEVPNSATVVMDLIGDDSAKDWEKTKVTHTADFEARNLSVTGNAWLRPKFAFVAELKPLGKFEASIKMDLPKLEAKGSLKLDVAGGACPKSNAEDGFGLNLDATLGGLYLNVGGSILSKSWSAVDKLLVRGLSFLKKDFCFPFEGSESKGASLAMAPPEAAVLADSSVAPNAASATPASTAPVNVPTHDPALGALLDSAIASL